MRSFCERVLSPMKFDPLDLESISFVYKSLTLVITLCSECFNEIEFQQIPVLDNVRVLFNCADFVLLAFASSITM